MRKWICAVGLVAALALGVSARAQLALGTSFTYQGQLKDGGVVVNDIVSITLQLFDANTDGAQVGPTQNFAGVAVLNGTFTVQPDFGAGVFAGSRRWVQVTVNGEILAPRQEITPTPYALYAMNPGPQGPAGPQGPSGVITTVSSNAGVGSNLSASNNGVWAFAGSVPTITVGAGQTLHVQATAAIGIAAGGTAKAMDYNVGFRASGSTSAPTELAINSYLTVKLLPGLRLPFTASYSRSGLAPGNYQVGLIVRAPGTDGGAFNDNDWSLVHVWVSQP
ncbi:MAG: hypothetical protein J0L78_07925 [Planctomycetes bacterium]|nr:hypothetical protein [Planctomycetota bacterium]